MDNIFVKHITWERETRDFKATINGELIGYFMTRLEAETELDRLVLDLIKHSR